jgi:hypothetical protein
MQQELRLAGPRLVATAKIPGIAVFGQGSAPHAVRRNGQKSLGCARWNSVPEHPSMDNELRNGMSASPVRLLGRAIHQLQRRAKWQAG